MKYTYGDEVLVKNNAPLKYRPGELGAVCGITIIDNKQLSEYYGLVLGTITYTVEYIDGSDCQVPEEYLIFEEPYESILKRNNNL